MAEIDVQIEPQYPDAEPVIIWHNENAGSVMGNVARSMKGAGAPVEEVESWYRIAMSGNYSELLASAARFVPVVML